MRRLRRSIREHDIFWWVDSFMHAAFTRDLNSFPLSPDYVAEAQQDYLADQDKLSLDGDIEISDKSIACWCRVRSLSQSSDRLKVGTGFTSGHKYLVINNYHCLARSLHEIRCGTRFAERHSSMKKCHDSESPL